MYQAIESMAEKKVGALLVMESGELVGIISERDYARKVILQGRVVEGDSGFRHHEQSGDLPCRRQHTVGECMRIITDNHLRHLPVVEDGRWWGWFRSATW